jgi:biopolymer transport protein ExbD
MAVTLKDPQDGGLTEVSDINVTPFIDVMLVLLIIFMVAAPLSTVDVPVNLPVSNAEPQPKPDKPIFLTVKSDLSLSLGEDTVQRDALQGALDKQTGGDHDKRIFLRADGAVSYKDLMQVMNLLRDADYLKIALIGLEDTGQGDGDAAGAGSGVPAVGSLGPSMPTPSPAAGTEGRLPAAPPSPSAPILAAPAPSSSGGSAKP